MCIGEVKPVCRDGATYRGLVELRTNLSVVKPKRRSTKLAPADSKLGFSRKSLQYHKKERLKLGRLDQCPCAGTDCEFGVSIISQVLPDSASERRAESSRSSPTDGQLTAQKPCFEQ
jgi:hypothetical protein